MAVKPGVDYAALKEEALKLAREGHRSRAISRKLGIGRTTVHSWLKEAGIEPITTDNTEQRKQTLKLAYAGVQPAVIARQVGITPQTVRKWLREAGFNTFYGADASLPCPECDGKMVKQELFFWKCSSCGAEWWPPEDMVPENPDEWTTEARLAVDPATLTLVQELLDEGRSYREISEILNREGYRPVRGDEWTESAVELFVRRRKLKGDYQAQRQRVLEIVERMACAGYNCREIADRLNAEGLRTSRGRPFTTNAVHQVIVDSLKLDIKMSPGAHGIPRIKLESNGPHPWRRDEDARRAMLKARRRENALPDLPGGNGAAR